MKKMTIDNGMGREVEVRISYCSKERYTLNTKEINEALSISNNEGKLESIRYLILLDYWNLGYISFENFELFLNEKLYSMYGITIKDLLETK